MQPASYILSLFLHAAVILIILYWPATPPVRLDQQAVMISLVEGDMGGSRTPSNILGHMGEPDEGELAPTAPAPKKEIAAPAQEEVQGRPNIRAVQKLGDTQEQEKKPEMRKEEKKTPPTETKPAEKKEEPKKVEQKKAEPKPRPAPEKARPVEKPKEEKKDVKKEEKKDEKKDVKEKKEEKKEEKKDVKKDEKKDEKKADTSRTKGARQGSSDPVADALRQARRSASSRAESGDRGNAVEQALAQAKRNAGGTRGGGGGEGRGPGGGGLGDVYRGQVLLAVRPNWGYASSARQNLTCLIRVNVDMQGKVQEAKVSKSSGNVQFDNSAVSAIWRTSNGGTFPPPPSAAFTDLELSFSLNELMGR